MTIHEGRKRQVRRMCEAVGHRVDALERVAFGPLRLGTLPRRRAPAADRRRGRAAARRGQGRPRRSGSALIECRAMRLYALRGATTVTDNDARRDPRARPTS